jgi:hypothetical protein
MPEEINHPAHYGGDDEYEVIKVLEAWNLELAKGFCWGNLIKYSARAGKKGSELADQQKAEWYASRLVTITATLAGRQGATEPGETPAAENSGFGGTGGSSALPVDSFDTDRCQSFQPQGKVEVDKFGQTWVKDSKGRFWVRPAGQTAYFRTSLAGRQGATEPGETPAAENSGFGGTGGSSALPVDSFDTDRCQSFQPRCSVYRADLFGHTWAKDCAGRVWVRPKGQDEYWRTELDRLPAGDY